MSVLSAVQAEIAELDESVRSSSLAESAFVLAADIDAVGTAPSSRANCARALADVLERLRVLSVEAAGSKGGDGIDDLAKRRSARLAGS